MQESSLIMMEKNMPRKPGLEADWKKVLEDFTVRGCSVKQFCQERHLAKATLYKWSHRLGIPVTHKTEQTASVQKGKNAEGRNGDIPKAPFSFIELKVPSPMTPACPVTLELLGTQERQLKIETTSSWEGIIIMIKSLMS